LSDNNKKVFFKTFGCRTNHFDTQAMITHLKDNDLCEDEKLSDVIVVNSCTVTNGADVDVRQYINKIKNNFPNKKILLTGCGSFSKGKSLLEANKVNGVFGHSNKTSVDNFIAKKSSFYEIGNLSDIDETIVSEFAGKTRAFLKIQEGCDFKCSYCIIPAVRGASRTLNEDNILKQITLLVDNGFSEFILTGINVGSYGKKQNTSLAKLIKKIMLITGVKRIRIGSMEPSQIDDEFKELIKEDIMSRHYHIAIQHTNDEMLKIMRRRNTFKKDKILFDFFANNGCAIGTDFIVGHPGESEEIWQDAILRIQDLPLSHIHPFVYSKRDNTYSATLKNIINGAISKKRLKNLKSLIDNKNFEFRKNKQDLKVLVESKKDDFYYGLDQFFNKIKIKSNQSLKGKWLNINQYDALSNINMATI
jgi:MiaB-like tRNA modifying enzyme